MKDDLKTNITHIYFITGDISQHMIHLFIYLDNVLSTSKQTGSNSNLNVNPKSNKNEK